MCLRMIILTILLFILYTTSIAQPSTNTVEPVQQEDENRKPTAKEDREARELVMAFIKRYEETQDIKPLIKEFFIKDFSARLKVCYATDRCEGSDKDFFQFGEKSVAQKAMRLDLLRFYTGLINQYFLYYYQLTKYLVIDDVDSYEEIARSIIIRELVSLLKNDAKLSKFVSDYFGIDLITGVVHDKSVSNPFKFKSVKQVRVFLRNLEKLNTAFRKLARKFRSEQKQETPRTKRELKANDLELYAEPSRGEFFNYPTGTRIIEVWGRWDISDSGFFPFKIDLIEEHSNLRIIAIYPPMD